jgi:hypothetical protein
MATQQGGGIPTSVDLNMTLTNADQKLAIDKAFDDTFGKLSDPAPAPVPDPEPPKTSPTEPDLKPVPPIPDPPKPKDPEPPKPKEPEPPKPKEPEPPKPKDPEPPKPADTPQVDPDDEEDEELDKIQLHPDSRPETVRDFRKVRGAAKVLKKDNKKLVATNEELRKENEGLKAAVRPVSDPTVQAELDQLRKFQQDHQVFDDTTYQVTYEEPVRAHFEQVINLVKGMATDKDALAEWEKSIRHAGPDKLDRAFWTSAVIEQCQDPLNRDRLVRQINNLLESQEKRDAFRKEMSEKPDAYAQFRNQTAANYWKQFSIEAEDEAHKLVPTLGEWAAPRNLEEAKSQAEREAWEAHNKTYQTHELRFKQFITDAATGGPRGMTRVAVEAVRGAWYKDQYEAQETQIKKLKADLAQAQAELDKISAVRSKATQGTGTNGSGAPTNKPKIGQSVEDAMNKEWGKLHDNR